MFCPNCGTQLPDASRFCESCGAALQEAPEPAEAAPRPRPSPNIEFCADGVYRWIYEFDMIRNPVILITILKIFAYVALVIAALSFLFSLGGSESLLTKLGNALLTGAIPFAILSVLTFPAYLIVTARNGKKYIVIFEMDEEGITHRQEPEQFTKAQGLAWLSVMAGAGTGSLGAAGAGLLAATHDSTHSDFAHVRSMKVLRRWNTIKLNQPLAKNQIYAEPEDFDFVLQFIAERIPEKARRG